MMFKATEENLHKVFKEQRYRIPYYQRPYAWTVDKAQQLFEDLYTAFNEGRADPKLGGYFLGSIVLIGDDNAPRYEVVDGQQRLTTLQLLLCALAARIYNVKNKADLLGYVRSEKNIYAGIEPESVVETGQRYRPYFEKIINFEDVELPVDEASPEYLMKKNYDYFFLRISDFSEEKIQMFAVFMMQKCYLAALRAESQINALRIFSVLNDRGIDLHPVDILKVRLLDKTNYTDGKKLALAERWEQEEFELGRDNFQNLFVHIRMIYVKRRPQKLLHEEVMDHISSGQIAAEFLEKELPEYCDCFDMILRPEEAELRRHIKLLEQAGHRDWMPVALHVLKNKSEFGAEISSLLWRTVCVSVMMQCARFGEGQRVGRYGRILTDLEDMRLGRKRIDELPSLKIGDDEFRTVEAGLRSNAYGLRKPTGILMWIESLFGDGSRVVEGSRVTVEHLLPNNVGSEEYWLSRFPKEKWELMSNSIGNLVLVSSKLNAEMARKSYQEKIAAIKKKKGTPWVVTSMVFEEPEWDEAAVNRRSNVLVKAVKDAMYGQGGRFRLEKSVQ